MINRVVYFLGFKIFMAQIADFYMKGKEMNSEIKTRSNVNGYSSILNSLKQELIRTREKAEKSEKLKLAFLNNISHEIRTPLNGILGFIDFFDNDLSKADREQFITIMRKSGERLLNTVDNIIEMSKLETGNIELAKSVFNLHEALNEFNKEIRHRYSKPNIKYFCTIDVCEKQLQVKADRSKIFRILKNLIDNAYKFTEKGFVKLTVKQERDTLIFEVEDTGIGIENENRKVIFDPFRQVDFNLNRKYEGNGLGLTISKKLIHLMGGELINKSPDHKGAKFICTFPGVAHNFKKVNKKQKVLTIKIY